MTTGPTSLFKLGFEIEVQSRISLLIGFRMIYSSRETNNKWLGTPTKNNKESY